MAADGIATDRVADRFAVMNRRRIAGSAKDMGMLNIYEVEGGDAILEHEIAGGLRAVDFVGRAGDGTIRLAVLDRTGSVHSLKEKMLEGISADVDGATRDGKAPIEYQGPQLFSNLAGRVVGVSGADGSEEARLPSYARNAGSGVDVLDVPNYLLPGLASVFDSFVAGLVSVRPIVEPILAEEAEPAVKAFKKPEAEVDDDVEMDEAPATEDDYSFLSDLFRKQNIQAANGSAPKSAKKKRTE